MMGLPNWQHWLAWFIKSFCFLMISCLIITILLKVGAEFICIHIMHIIIIILFFILSNQVRFSEAQKLPIIPKTDGTLLYFILLIFSFSAICFCFFVSSFFSRGKQVLILPFRILKQYISHGIHIVISCMQQTRRPLVQEQCGFCKRLLFAQISGSYRIMILTRLYYQILCTIWIYPAKIQFDTILLEACVLLWDEHSHLDWMSNNFVI